MYQAWYSRLSGASHALQILRQRELTGIRQLEVSCIPSALEALAQWVCTPREWRRQTARQTVKTALGLTRKINVEPLRQLVVPIFDQFPWWKRNDAVRPQFSNWPLAGSLPIWFSQLYIPRLHIMRKNRTKDGYIRIVISPKRVAHQQLLQLLCNRTVGDF